MSIHAIGIRARLLLLDSHADLPDCLYPVD